MRVQATAEMKVQREPGVKDGHEAVEAGGGGSAMNFNPGGE